MAGNRGIGRAKVLVLLARENLIISYHAAKFRRCDREAFMTSEESKPSRSEEDRREFLKSVGRFAAVTPPVITMLLSTSLTSDAIAASGSGEPARHAEG
jgi:hypothetical protein